MGIVAAAQQDAVNTTFGQMLPIAVATLRPVTSLDFNLYLIPTPGRPPLLFRERRYRLTQEDLDRLEVGGHETLYTTFHERTRYETYLKENLDDLLADERTEPRIRYALLQECASGQLDIAFRMVGATETVQACAGVGRHMVELLNRSEVNPSQLFDVMKHDYYTATHMFNVSTYCVALAKLLQISDEKQLETIAVGGLLHDLGKLSIPPHILNKTGPLTPEEKAIIASHPQVGFEKLRGQPELEWAQLMMVYQHHEKLDGSGYPVQCVGEDIHWLAKICAVVDIFDAMTCARSYRKPLPVSDVLSHLERMAGDKLDKEMVDCWISAVHSTRQ